MPSHASRSPGLPDVAELGVPADRAGREAYVRSMFDRIAHRYDLLNRLLSFGQDVLWRRAAARVAAVPGVRRVLDVAAGTGDLGREVLRRLGPGGQVVAVDFAPEMMRLARSKLGIAGPGRARVVGANALALPFRDKSFDASVMGFAARNVADLRACFQEMGRVVRPGGRVVCLELSHPVGRLWAGLYRWYFYRVVPLVGGLVIGRRGPYDYLPRSLTWFPTQQALARVMEEAGLCDVRYVNLLGGVAALHVGQVPTHPGNRNASPAGTEEARPEAACIEGSVARRR